MTERIVDISVVERDRQEASAIARSPYIKGTLKEAQIVIQNTFDANKEIIDLEKNCNFISGYDRYYAFINQIKDEYVLLPLLLEKGIKLKDEHSLMIPDYLITEKQGKLTFNISTAVLRRFCDTNPDNQDSIKASIASVSLFSTLAAAVIDKLAQPIDVDTDTGILQKLAKKAISEIPGMVEDPLNTGIREIIHDLENRVADRSRLSLRLKGSLACLMLDGKILKEYFEDEDAMLLTVFRERLENTFLKRIKNSKIRGQKWFSDPSNWPEDVEYRNYQDLSNYKIFNEMVDRGNYIDYLTNFINGEFASALLKRDGVEHKKSDEVLMSLNAQELLKESASSESESGSLEVIKNEADEGASQGVLTEGIIEEVITDVVPIAEEPATEEQSSKETVIDVMVEFEKPKKEKKKKKKPTSKPQQPKRFGKNAKKTKPEPKNEEKSEDLMYIVKPSQTFIENARITRRFENRARKLIGVAKKETREREALEKELIEKQRQERLERQRILKAQKQKLAAEAKQNEDKNKLNGSRTREPVNQLAKALIEANAPEVIKENEKEAERLEGAILQLAKEGIKLADTQNEVIFYATDMDQDAEDIYSEEETGYVDEFEEFEKINIIKPRRKKEEK